HDRVADPENRLCRLHGLGPPITSQWARTKRHLPSVPICTVLLPRWFAPAGSRLNPVRPAVGPRANGDPGEQRPETALDEATCEPQTECWCFTDRSRRAPSLSPTLPRRRYYRAAQRSVASSRARISSAAV